MIRADGFFGTTLDVWPDSRFWLLWLGLSHFHAAAVKRPSTAPSLARMDSPEQEI